MSSSPSIIKSVPILSFSVGPKIAQDIFGWLKLMKYSKHSYIILDRNSDTSIKIILAKNDVHFDKNTKTSIERTSYIYESHLLNDEFNLSWKNDLPMDFSCSIQIVDDDIDKKIPKPNNPDSGVITFYKNVDTDEDYWSSSNVTGKIELGRSIGESNFGVVSLNVKYNCNIPKLEKYKSKRILGQNADTIKGIFSQLEKPTTNKTKSLNLNDQYLTINLYEYHQDHDNYNENSMEIFKFENNQIRGSIQKHNMSPETPEEYNQSLNHYRFFINYNSLLFIRSFVSNSKETMCNFMICDDNSLVLKSRLKHYGMQTLKLNPYQDYKVKIVKDIEFQEN